MDSFFYLQYQKAGSFPLLIVEQKKLPSMKVYNYWGNTSIYLIIETTTAHTLQELYGKIKRLINKPQSSSRDSGIFDNSHDLDPDEVLWAKSKLNR